MATLRKRKGSAHWYLDWHEHPGNSGRRVLCTGIRHNNAKNPPREGAAWDILRAKEDELARRKFGLARSIVDIPVAAYFETHLQWLKDTSGDIAPGTLKRYRSTVIVFNRWAKEQRLENFSQFDYTACARFVQFRSQDRSSKTVDMDCAFLAQVWTEAKHRNHVAFENNPWARLKPKSVKSETRRPLNAAELAHLFAQLPGLQPWESYLLFTALYTGARLTSIVLLPRDQVNGTIGVISFPDEIVKEAPYTVPLHPTLADYLRTYAGGDKTHFVPLAMRRWHLRNERAQSRMLEIFAHWRRKTKLFQGVTFHCLRHTFATRLRECGVSPGDTQLLVGHATAAMTDEYTHVEAIALKPAIAKLTY